MTGVILNRPAPKMAVQAYQTYQVLRPMTRQYWREVTCEQFDCARRRDGWQQTIDLNTELGQRQAKYIKYEAGRSFVKVDAVGGVVVLRFLAGQDCFETHRVPAEIEPIYVVRGGDWRGDPGTVRKRQVVSGRAWLDDYGENQEKLADLARRG